MQRLTWIYLATYLLIGGCGFLVAPAFALRLVLSNGDYGDVMPRLFGLFMFVLGGVIFQFVRARDYGTMGTTYIRSWRGASSWW